MSDGDDLAFKFKVRGWTLIVLGASLSVIAFVSGVLGERPDPDGHGMMHALEEPGYKLQFLIYLGLIAWGVATQAKSHYIHRR